MIIDGIENFLADPVKRYTILGRTTEPYPFGKIIFLLSAAGALNGASPGPSPGLAVSHTVRCYHIVWSIAYLLPSQAV